MPRIQVKSSTGEANGLTAGDSFDTVSPEKVAMSFKQLSMSSLFPPKPILTNVSGFVVKGGITAIMGASASGKSLLMQTLAGRLPDLHVTGEVTCGGAPIDLSDWSNDIGYVPQDEFLMGEFTPREILLSKHQMARGDSTEESLKAIDDLLSKFGLQHVANNPLGTVFVRGLSGGQRKRVEVCSELIAPPNVLFLDEPTSGLDGAIAYDILSAMKDILKSSNGKLSLIISIHQPNTRILELFDHIMLVGGGGMLFFGTLPQAMKHFDSLGVRPPADYNPLDVFLKESDANFRESREIDFEGSFACSKLNGRLNLFLDDVRRIGVKSLLHNHADPTTDLKEIKIHPQNAEQEVKFESSLSSDKKVDPVLAFMRHYWNLLYRDFALAYRDPSLYYLQFILVSVFGFLVGAAFFKLKAEIGAGQTDIPSGLLWLVLMMSYIQVFKVFHLNKANLRFKHEASNKTYSPLSYWFAELTATAVLLLSFVPGTIIAYFMMDLPAEGYPFMLFLYWLTALTAESMLNFISKFSTDATVSIVTSQAVLVILTVFGGGMFIAWNKCPDYWVWLQEISIFTQSSRSAIMNVSDYLRYSCQLSGDSQCIDSLGRIYECIPGSISNGSCDVDGREVLYVMQGTSMDESKWVPFGYLVLMFVVFRLLCLLLAYYPVEQIFYSLQNWYSGISSGAILDTQLGLRRIEGQLNAYIALRTLEENHDGRELATEQGQETNSSRQGAANEHAIVQQLFSGADASGQVMSLAEGSALEWRDLSVVLKKKGTRLVDNVSGVALPGRICALMGPSGAGKTTLLNALSNRAPYADLLGEVKFGGRPFLPSDLVYVPQFDEFNKNLTVYEQIGMVGALKCKDIKEMHVRLANLIGILGLSDKMKVRCKDLTSGELKRVSVGMGMISNPNVLFLDEPTTGLDSSAAYSIVKYIAELSRATNVVVIMTIHQPAQMVFDMLQDLYLLEGGRLAFYGPLFATKQYFSKLNFQCPSDVNPADFFLDLVNQHPDKNDSSVTWNSIYEKSDFSKNLSKVVSVTLRGSPVAKIPSESPSSLTRLKILLQFFMKYYIRDAGFYYLRLTFLLIVALFMGTLFLQLEPTTANVGKYSGAIFFSIWATLFSAVAATGLMASDRRLAIEQVKNAVLTPSVYCLAQFTVSVPFNFVVSLAFQAIFHWMIDLNPHSESFIYAVLLTCGHLMLMEAIMLCVVAALKNAMLSVTFAMVVLGYLFLFAGFFIVVDDMPPWINWICYITPTMYSFNGYLWQIYSNQNFKVTNYPGVEVAGKVLLDSIYKLKDVKSWGMFGVLLAWVGLFRFAHYGLFLFDVFPYLKSSPASDDHGKMDKRDVEQA